MSWWERIRLVVENGNSSCAQSQICERLLLKYQARETIILIVVTATQLTLKSRKNKRINWFVLTTRKQMEYAYATCQLILLLLLLQIVIINCFIFKPIVNVARVHALHGSAIHHAIATTMVWLKWKWNDLSTIVSELKKQDYLIVFMAPY